MSVTKRRGRGNALNKLVYDEIELLARRMWKTYVRAQPTAERSHYRPWAKLVDDDTPRGFRAVARMVLREVDKGLSAAPFDQRDGAAYIFVCPVCKTENWIDARHVPRGIVT